MEKIYNIFLGLPPHNIDINHPLHLNFGIFFHLKKSSNFNKQYVHITDWLDTQNNIQNFYELKQLEEFVRILDKNIKKKQRIAEAKQKDARQQVGIYFMKFCAKYNLERMSQHPNDYAEFMNGKA